MLVVGIVFMMFWIVTEVHVRRFVESFINVYCKGFNKSNFQHCVSKKFVTMLQALSFI